jgi:hypothetical protein
MRFLKKSIYIISCLVIFIAAILITPPQRTYAASCDRNFFSGNDILFYDPCVSVCTTSGGSLTSTAPTKLKGVTNTEKVWNYFTERGLTPIAAAGAMGNIKHESGFNPWIGESGSTSINPSDVGVGFGLIQWTNTEGDTNGRRYKVIKAMEAAGISLSEVNQNDQTQTDTALLVQLNWLWDGEYERMTWQRELNDETKLEGDSSIASYNSEYSSSRASSQVGNGSTLLFHALVERSNDTPTMLQGRIDSAQEFLNRFAGGASSDCSGETTDIIEMAKRVKDGAKGLQVMDGLKRGIRGLDCGDCVAFVTTVYAAAGYPKPFNGTYDDENSGIRGSEAGPGNGSQLPKSRYVYDPKNYEVIPNSEKRPGDILAWSTHVAIYAGGNEAYEGGGGEGSNPSNWCNIGKKAWYSVDNAEVVRYKGSPIQ